MNVLGAVERNTSVRIESPMLDHPTPSRPYLGDPPTAAQRRWVQTPELLLLLLSQTLGPNSSSQNLGKT